MASDKDRVVYTRRQALGLGAAALGITAVARMFPAFAADVHQQRDDIDRRRDREREGNTRKRALPDRV